MTVLMGMVNLSKLSLQNISLWLVNKLFLALSETQRIRLSKSHFEADLRAALR
jgi:hypothetical protein